MATYGEKVRKWEARVRKAVDLGLEPDPKCVEKLIYYVGRAEKKGKDHQTKPIDKMRNVASSLRRNAEGIAEVLAAAKKILS